MLIANDPSARDDRLPTAFTGINSTGTTGSAPDYEDPLADVFGSDTDSTSAPTNENDNTRIDRDGQTRSAQEGPSDITRLRSIHVTNGYREGIGLGKEETIQAGFDEGYALGAEFGIVIGRITGRLEALLDVVPRTSSDPDEVSQVVMKDLVSRARKHLSVEELFGPSFFDETGLWTYPIRGETAGAEVDESETTFRRVAASHPTIIEMSKLAEDAVQQCGLSLGESSTPPASHDTTG